METTKHTPTKWKWSVTSYTGHIGTEEFSTVTYDITTDAGVMVLSQRVENNLNGHTEGNNRAALIVEAVNSFDSLRTALKTLADDAHAMLNVLPACTGNAAAMAHVLSTSIDKARAALGGE